MVNPKGNNVVLEHRRRIRTQTMKKNPQPHSLAHSPFTIVSLRDGSAQTIVRAPTLR